MKKTIFTIALVAGLAFGLQAQTGNTGADGNTSKDNKPKTAVEESKANGTATSGSGTEAKSATDTTSQSATAEKKCAKKSCCKKSSEAHEGKCNKDHSGDAACCKKKAGEATESKKE